MTIGIPQGPGWYEVQIIGDHGRAVDTHSHGSVHGRIAPTSNQSRPAGEWQRLDAALVGRHVMVTFER